MKRHHIIPAIVLAYGCALSGMAEGKMYDLTVHTAETTHTITVGDGLEIAVADGNISFGDEITGVTFTIEEVSRFTYSSGDDSSVAAPEIGQAHISIYPSYICVSGIEGRAACRIHSVAGILVNTHIIDGSATIDLTGLAPGTYIITIDRQPSIKLQVK